MVTYYKIPPPVVLKPYVRFFWVFEIDNIQQPYVYRSMADGCIEMIFHYNGLFRNISNNEIEPCAMIHGSTDKYNRYITYDQSFGIFGVYMYPFAVNRLLKLSAQGIANHTPDLYSLLGSEGTNLEQKILVTKSNAERYKILSAYLERKLVDVCSFDTPVEVAIRELIHNNNDLSVDDLAKKYSLSRRQFERKFKENTGFSPKKYNRIIRFGKAMNNYGLHNKSLTDIAYECGYYDQAHFIHDFKEFSGYTPQTFFSGNAEGIDYRDA